MLNIIPKPLKVNEGQGAFQVNGETLFSFDPAFEKEKAQWISYFKSHASFTPKIVEEGAVFCFEKKAGIPEEGYEMEISTDKAVIKASTGTGLFYAMQTLRQIMELDVKLGADTLQVPCCVIEDAPQYKWRSFMLDEARHFFGMDVVKEILNMMAFYKFNVFHWHLTEDQGWRIEIKKYPLLTEKGSIRKYTPLKLTGYNQKREPNDGKEYGRGMFYTQEQVKEIVAYAAELHINIIPEVDMPGHLVSAIACYPELSCFGEKVDVSARWGVMDNIGCCGKDAIYTFAKDVIDEMCELFPFPYFHIGGDEVPKGNWKKCPDCQKKMKELGLSDENDLQGYFNNQILAHLKSKGKDMVGWNEILEASTLDKGTIVQWWTDTPTKKNEVCREKKWLDKGGKVILCKHNHVYLDYFYTATTMEKLYAYGPEAMGITPEQEKNVMGIEAPMWTEYIRDKERLDLHTYPRLQALSEACWTKKENKDYSDFDRRLTYHETMMDGMRLNYAERELYELKGFKGWLRKKTSHSHWLNDPYWEVNLNREYKKKKSER